MNTYSLKKLPALAAAFLFSVLATLPTCAATNELTPGGKEREKGSPG